MNSPIPVKPATLPNDVRELIARAMGYADADALLYWGTGGAAKRFDDTCAALAGLWPTSTSERVTAVRHLTDEQSRAYIETARVMSVLWGPRGPVGNGRCKEHAFTATGQELLELGERVAAFEAAGRAQA